MKYFMLIEKGMDALGEPYHRLRDYGYIGDDQELELVIDDEKNPAAQEVRGRTRPPGVRVRLA